MNNYTLESNTPIGAGTYGKVFLARKNDGSRVVLKQIGSGSTMAFVSNEILAGKKLSHSRIPKYHGSFTKGSSIFLAFDYLANHQDLFAFLEERNFAPLPERRLTNLFYNIVETLNYVHSKGLAHMDIKLENVMVNLENGEFSLIDFGLCKVVENDSATYNDLCGSSEYIAPEMYSKKNYLPKLCDIYSLGVVFYCLLFGEFPFNNNERIAAIRHNSPAPEIKFPASSTVSESMRRLVLRMIASDPTARISTGELLQTLSQMKV